jgi:DNA-binding LytR/AlgR family response regulator
MAMEKIRCIAIDDEPPALRQIGAYVSKTPFLDLISLCSNAFDAMEVLKKEAVDVMFVDISMPDLSGLDFVKSLTEKPYVVFTTAFSDYALEGFKVEAIDYLLKPIGYDDFLKAVNKVRSRLEQAGRNVQAKHQAHAHIFIKSGYKLLRIELENIRYVESMHEYVRLHLENAKPVMTLASMKSIEELLPGDIFMRVHRSFIVNTSKITVVERNRIIFDNVHIPVSDQYKTRFQEFLSRNSLE